MPYALKYELILNVSASINLFELVFLHSELKNMNSTIFKSALKIWSINKLSLYSKPLT